MANRYVSKTTNNAIKNFQASTKKKEAEEMLPKVASMIDKLSQKNIIHKNKAAHLKSKLSRHVKSL